MTRLSIATIIACFGTSANAQVFTFEGLAHGQILTSAVPSEGAGMSVGVSAINPNRSHDTAAIFNTQIMGSTADPDLQGPPWGGGNLAPGTVLGNAVIIAQNNTDNDNDGILDDRTTRASAPPAR